MTWMILQVLSITIQAQQLAAGSSFGTLWNSAWKRQTQQGDMKPFYTDTKIHLLK